MAAQDHLPCGTVPFRLDVPFDDPRQHLRDQGENLVRQARGFAEVFPAGAPPCLSAARSLLGRLRA